MSYQPASRSDEEHNRYAGPPQYSHDVKAGYSDPAMEPLAHKELHGMRETDLTLKKRIRWMKLVTRIATFLLAIYTVYTQSNSLDRYLNTRGIVRNGRNPWASGTTIWPTALLLSTSCLTVIYSMITIGAYFWGVKHANAASTNIGTPVVVLELLAHVGIWIGTAVAYRVGKTGSDLWGWSCSTKAGSIQTIFPEVNFDFLCSTQTSSWYVSIAQVALFVVTCMAWGLAWRRSNHQKKTKIRESILMSPALSGNMGHANY